MHYRVTVIWDACAQRIKSLELFWQMLTIVLALVADIIGVLIIVFDVLFQDTDMPEKVMIRIILLLMMILVMNQSPP